MVGYSNEDMKNETESSGFKEKSSSRLKGFGKKLFKPKETVPPCYITVRDGYFVRNFKIEELEKVKEPPVYPIVTKETETPVPKKENANESSCKRRSFIKLFQKNQDSVELKNDMNKSISNQNFRVMDHSEDTFSSHVEENDDADDNTENSGLISNSTKSSVFRYKKL